MRELVDTKNWMNVRYLAADPQFLNNTSGEDLVPFLSL